MKERAKDMLALMEVVVAGVAPTVPGKEGAKLFNETRRRLMKQAGIEMVDEQ